MSNNTHIDVIVVGGGQAGLSVGYHLKRRGLRFLILDASDRIGDAWRKRWDSLRLFTPAKFSSLDGMAFPTHPDHFPTKDEMADYLEAYAARFELPVLSGVRVTRLSRQATGYRVEAGERVFEADQVVVAMANHQSAWAPEFAKELDPDIVQLHSKAYRNPSQLKPGPVLLVGAGNSGAEIAQELSSSHDVSVSGPSTGELPFQPSSYLGRLFLARLVLRVLFHRILTIKTFVGRLARPAILRSGAPLIRVKSKALQKYGVKRVPRTVKVEDGRPVMEDGQALDVQNVIWCTGYRTGFSWIDLPIIDDRGEPLHEAGVVPDAPGLFFVGLHFLFSLSSEMIHGVGRDAARITQLLFERAQTAEPQAERPWRGEAA